MKTIQLDRRKSVWLALILCAVAVAAKILLEHMDNMTDPALILYDALTGSSTGYFGYDFTEDFFAFLMRFLPFRTVTGWSIFLGVLGTIALLAFLLLRYRGAWLRLDQLAFLAMLTGLVNLYTFNISKESFQFLLMLPLFIAALWPKGREGIRLAVIVLNMIPIAIYMRSYYFLIAAAFVALAVLFFLVPRRQESRYILLEVCIFLALTLALLYALRAVKGDTYDHLVNIRNIEISSASWEANTRIDDWITAKTPLAFFANWLLSFLRLLFPLELVTKGGFQIVACIFQVYFSLCLIYVFIANVRKPYAARRRDVSYLPCAILLANLLVAAIFEPDYGSFLRHEVMFFPLMLEVVMSVSAAGENANTSFFCVQREMIIKEQSNDVKNRKN